MIKPSWVKYKNMGGPRYLGQKKNGKRGAFLHPYDPSPPWGVWTQILGLVAACEGNHDTVVMYDNTGVTFGVFQWTFTSGRLQKLLEFMKSIPWYDFESDDDSTAFEELCMNGDRQIFEDFGFSIESGFFVEDVIDDRLNPRKKRDKERIVDICLGRTGGGKKQALSLCRLFAELGQREEMKAIQQDYAKLEFKRALGYKRPPLSKVGGTINALLPDELWGTPVPGIFFCLWQNSPGGTYKLFSRAMRACKAASLVDFDPEVGFFNVRDPNAVTYKIWEAVCLSKYADWGFGSKQYLSSGKKNPPRVMRMRPAIERYYGEMLPWIGK